MTTLMTALQVLYIYVASRYVHTNIVSGLALSYCSRGNKVVGRGMLLSPTILHPTNAILLLDVVAFHPDSDRGTTPQSILSYTVQHNLSQLFLVPTPYVSLPSFSLTYRVWRKAAVRYLLGGTQVSPTFDSEARRNSNGGLFEDLERFKYP
jgi:hypothetical protein